MAADSNLKLKPTARIAAERPTDFGLKQLAFLLGVAGQSFHGAKLHGYEPIYGTGAAVVELAV